MKKINNNKAITLIALVITIIVLLILAGITVAQLSGNNLFENAKLAKEKYQQAREQEDEILGDYEDSITGDRGNKLNFSTEEQIIGTWVNGNPIYEITVLNLNLPTSGNTWTDTPIGTNNIDYLIDCTINWYDTADNCYQTNGRAAGGFNNPIVRQINGNWVLSLYSTLSADFSTRVTKSFAILKYTKTTD